MHDNVLVETKHAPSDKPGHSTGPRSRAGKAKSLNRLTHGLRSSITILRDEDPAEYEATVQSWLDIYEPQDRKEDELVHEIIQAHWQLKRCRRRLEEVEFNLPGNAWNWTDEHQKLYSNFSRYKTTAERSFNRWYKEMESYRGRQFREEQILEKARLAAAKVELQWLTEQEKNASKLIFTQVVEIAMDENGRCETTCFPSNEEILEHYPVTATETPLMMKRLLIFSNGVPPEYGWASPKQAEGCPEQQAWQRLSWSRWRDSIEYEQN